MGMRNKVVFLSWCPPNLLRPRAIQVGRTAKAVGLSGWEPTLISAKIDLPIERDMIDSSLGEHYAPFYARHISLPDTALSEPAEPSTSKFKLTKKSEKPWRRLAYEAAKKQLRWSANRLLVTFAQPWQDHEIGLELKKNNPALRWVAHFSDPWVDSPYFSPTGADAQEAARRTQDDVIRHADRLVFVTDMTADLVMRNYPKQLREKVSVIPHIVDTEITDSTTKKNPPDGPLIIAHSGSLYSGKRVPHGLFDALSRMNNDNALHERLKVCFIGDRPNDGRDLISHHALDKVIESTTPLYYHASLNEMTRSDYLFIIDADLPQSPFLPSKFADYLMTDRPIFALTPDDSYTHRVIQRMSYLTAPPNNADRIQTLLTELIEQKKQGMLEASPQHIQTRAECGPEAIGRLYDKLFNDLLAATPK